MKVLFIHSQCQNGGISRIVFSICELLKEQGDEGIFVFSRGFIPDQKKDICHMFGSKKEIGWHMLFSRLFDSHGFHSKKATNELISYIEAYKPNIIHLNNVHGYYLNIDIFFEYLRKKGIPIVWTMHDCWAITGHCSHFEYYNCERWKAGCKKCVHKDVYPASWFLNRSNENYTKKKNLFTGQSNLSIVVPSKWLLNIIKASYLKEYPCRVINNGINLNVFCEKSTIPKGAEKYCKKKIVLAVASVWTERKGYKDLFELSKIMDKNKYVLVVIGVTEKQKEELNRQGIEAILHTKSVEELAAWYSCASVFVNPTYEDTFPTVNIEALACGTPVITYKTGGSPEIITRRCGQVIEKGNIQLLYETITNIKKDSLACREVSLQYNANAKFKEYLRLYEEIYNKELPVD